MNFTDISNEHWAYKAIAHGVDKKYINGYEDGSFRPGGHITRAEYCALIARRDPDYDSKILYVRDFADCDGREWFHSYASFCYMKGYINAYPIEGTDKIELKPSLPITREEAFVGLANTIEEV